MRVRETIGHRIAEAESQPIDVDAMIAKGCLSPKEAVAFSGLSLSQLHKHMDNGVLPYVRDGRARRIPRVALELFLRNRLVRRGDLVVAGRS